MSDIEKVVINTVKMVLAGRGKPDSELTAESGMGNPPEWDSLAFVAVFSAVNEEFGIDASDDDAIHFMTISDIVNFVRQSR